MFLVIYGRSFYSCHMTWHYSLYRTATQLAHPFLPAYLRTRAKRGKEDAVRMGEKFGRTALPRPNAPLIWIHAASMGESASVLPLITAWLEAHPTLRILLTTVTTTSAQFVATRLPERALHQYFPLDTPPAIARFLKHWKPDMACFVDSELWPNMLLSLKKRSIPTVLINGRISDNSAKHWRRAKPLMRQMLQCFTHVCAKSDTDALRFGEFGAPNPISFGNLKFSSPPLPAHAESLTTMQTAVQGRSVWLAASTHTGEEESVYACHQRVKARFPNLLTLLVPRHSARGDEVRALAEAQGLQVAQRSRNESITPSTDIYLADTMGEMGLWYRLCPIVWVGGSFIPHGGQNPFEPARLHCAVLYGTHMHNFTEFTAALEAAGASMMVKDADALTHALIRLLTSPQECERLANAAFTVTEQNKQVLSHIISALHADVVRVCTA
jgi:3-deoxy-D-manno-octulosonic-acid transferase